MLQVAPCQVEAERAPYDAPPRRILCSLASGLLHELALATASVLSRPLGSERPRAKTHGNDQTNGGEWQRVRRTHILGPAL
jgi:hypothetical protein